MRKTNRACTNEPFDMLMGFWIVAEAERRVMRMYQAGLVLEGGGMKGVYTAGVSVWTVWIRDGIAAWRAY